MAWMEDESSGSPKKTIWSYKDGIDMVTILENTSRDFALLTGDLDPTKTWTSPMGAWVHEFKTANGYATILCDKWVNACPFCYENEIYKQRNPNYKNTGGRLPYGMSKKGLLQVWDFQEKKVLWLLAGKKIQEGMDFILTKMADRYHGFVTITRTGRGLSTNYRVDISNGISLDEYAINTIASTMMPRDQVENRFRMTQAEIFKKSGVEPASYFSQKLPMKFNIDISNWGQIPKSIEQQISANSSNPTTPAQAQESQPVTPQANVTAPEPSPQALEAVNTICTVGMYKDKTFAVIIQEVGKPYIQYLLRSGSDVEKQSANIILNEWDVVSAFVNPF
jgi:hypothetical protein